MKCWADEVPGCSGGLFVAVRYAERSVVLLCLSLRLRTHARRKEQSGTARYDPPLPRKKVHRCLLRVTGRTLPLAPGLYCEVRRSLRISRVRRTPAFQVKRIRCNSIHVNLFTGNAHLRGTDPFRSQRALSPGSR